ncbi:MAG TPA: hypothetical protein PLV42_08300 [bacterium]|nr:hypothetical protein [bacterium]
MPQHAEPTDIERFLQLAAASEPFPESEFCGQRLEFFRAVLAELARREALTARDEAVCDKLIAALLAKKRFFDVASLYAAVKNRHGFAAGDRELHATFKMVLLRYIREIFTASLTYHSPELDALFCETLGNDRERFLELLGHLFEERRLYTMRLSPNIQKMFYSIADENVRHFVQFSNIHFLAFYLSAMKNLAQVTPAHLEKWISLLLSPTTNREIIDKVLKALQINPAGDFLLLCTLLARDDQRNIALLLLRGTLEKRPYLLRENRDALVFFLTRAISSHFYDFHRIPQDQKVTLSNLILFADDEKLFAHILAALQEQNPVNDAKQTETKKIFVAVYARLGEKEPRYLSTLRALLRDDTIEESVRQEIIRALRGLPQQEEKTMVSPLFGGTEITQHPQAVGQLPATESLRQSSPDAGEAGGVSSMEYSGGVVVDDPDPDEKTLISPMFGGSPFPNDDPEETTVVDKRPR